ncbi:MAG: hypothetical protein AAF708_16190, partial [Deinococcota bacterium]
MFVICLALISLGRAQDSSGTDSSGITPSGTTYALDVDSTVRRSLPASDSPGGDSITYHTYVVTLDASVDGLTIQVDGGDDDVDLVTQPGSIIERFADASYQGLDNSPQHRFTYLNLPPGEVYIDVVNKTDAPVSYTLTVTSRLVADITPDDTESASASVSPEPNAPEPNAEASTEDTSNPDTNNSDINTNDTSNDTANSETVNPETVSAEEDVDDLSAEPTGNYGTLELGETVTRRIVSANTNNGLAYHVYVLEVPTDVPAVTISVRGEDGETSENNANIDMVTNAGEPVTRYSSADFSGVGPNSSEQVSYDGAAGKRIYID